MSEFFFISIKCQKLSRRDLHWIIGFLVYWIVKTWGFTLFFACVAVQLSLQHIWWELNIYLKKVWTNPLFIWSFVGPQIGICLWLLVLFTMLLLAFLSNEIENITLLMALFFFHTHPCRCSGILKAKQWICLPQWWFYRAGYAIKCFIAWWFWGVISHISSLTEIYYFLLLMAVKDVWRNGLQGWPCKPHIQALSTESIVYIFPPPPLFFSFSSFCQALYA